MPLGGLSNALWVGISARHKVQCLAASATTSASVSGLAASAPMVLETNEVAEMNAVAAANAAVATPARHPVRCSRSSRFMRQPPLQEGGQGSRIEAPVVARDSRSRCALAASLSG